MTNSAPSIVLLAQVFALFDHDGSGRIGFRELKRVVTELGENIGDDEMREMIEEADRDGDGASRAPLSSLCSLVLHVFVRSGYVTFDDFYRIMKKRSDNPLDDLDDDDDF